MSSHLTTTSHLTALLCHLISPLHLTSRPYCVISSHHSISPHYLSVSPHLTITSRLTAWLCHLIYTYHYISPPYHAECGTSHHLTIPAAASLSVESLPKQQQQQKVHYVHMTPVCVYCPPCPQNQKGVPTVERKLWVHPSGRASCLQVFRATDGDKEVMIKDGGEFSAPAGTQITGLSELGRDWCACVCV